MKPVKFKGVNKVYAEDQPEYQQLPVIAMPGKYGQVISCWELTEEEKAEVLRTGQIYITVLTFNQALQPILPSVYLEEASNVQPG